MRLPWVVWGVFPLLLTSCLTSREEYLELLAHATDADGDGFAPAHGDCDDTDDKVFPGSVDEWYDGVDQDCDGADDFDVDLDGHVFPGDCDDEDDDIFPGAVDVCNGVDDDCDGQADEGLALTWYRDEDGDGQGNPLDAVESCLAPNGYTADARDCDDLNASVFHGASEVCNDGAINDCGATSSGCRLEGELPVTLLGEEALGGSLFGDEGITGWPGASLVVLRADGQQVQEDLLIVGAPRAPDEAEDLGALYLLPLNTFDGATLGDRALASIEGDVPGARFAARLAAVDGLPGWSGAGMVASQGWRSGAGTVWIVSPQLAGRWQLAGVSSLGMGTGSPPTALASLPRTDGAQALLVGQSGDDMDRGVVHLLESAEDAATVEAEAVTLWTGASAGDEAGAALCASTDLTGDGSVEIAIGAPGHESGGAVFLLGSGHGGGSLDGADGVVLGEGAGGRAGEVITCAPDVDGDGLSDVIVGDPTSLDGALAVGRAYVVTAGDWEGGSLASSAVRVTGDQDGAELGASARAEDLDGDGLVDLILGSPQQDRTLPGGGAVYVYYGPLRAGMTLDDADLVLASELGGDQLGASLLAGEDVDGDGLSDLILAAPLRGSRGARYGALYLLHGRGD